MSELPTISELKKYRVSLADQVEGLSHDLIMECHGGFNAVSGRPFSSEFPKGNNNFLIHRVDIVAADGSRIEKGKLSLYINSRIYMSLPVYIFPQGRYYEEAKENPGRLVSPPVLLQPDTQYGVAVDGLDRDYEGKICVILSGHLYRVTS